MRQVISNFLARLLKGTFPDKKHYAYFRHVDEGFEEVIHFVPLIVYLIHRIKERSDEVLITARQSGVILPPDFQAKIDFTMSYASAEAARGKHHRLTNVARNLEENVVKAAIGDVGETAAAKMGRAAAEAAAKAPPRMETPKYLPVEKPYDVPHTVYDKKKVEVPVIVKRYVKEEVPETPEVVTKTEHVYVHEKGYDCVEGFHNYQELWTEDQKRFCCWKHDRGCPSTHYKTKTEVKTRVKYVDVPVPSPPKIIERDHEEHITSFNCNEGFSNWYHGWSPLKKKYCCAHEDRGCPGSSHGHWEMHGHASAHVEGGGKATGKIYDCGAGFSNWLQGWSDSKKSWCCDHESKGCVKHHCFTGTISDWNEDKRDWCCRTHQRGCAHTTLSPLGCDAVCELHGESSTCHDRIHWVRDNVFGSRENNCALAYSKAGDMVIGD
eukprot:s5143_g1.t1